MEADFVTNDILIEDAFEADDNANNVNSTDNLSNEGERCGICMDIVIDRGVLDCCQHWFCFACIDNWATITSLCPLCQNEFQLITCVPVYDTIGSNKVEDDSFSRDDDWSIEGKSNTLSFPSYYIDENAVICLDGDGCKIRSGSATTEGDSSLDTSIACDSCDIWYHAFCVGFDPEGTSDTTWLCPRCVLDEVLERMDTSSLERTTMECNPENGNNDCQAEESFSGKVSVSVADTGETAVVVSLVEGNQWMPPSSEKDLSPLEVNKDPMTESCVSISDTYNHQRKTEKTIISPIMEEQELELSLSHNVFCSIPSNSLGPDDLKKSAYGERSEPDSFSEPKILNEFPNRTSPSRNESDMGLHLGLSVGSFLSVDDMDMNATKDQETDIQQLSPGEFQLKGYVKPNSHEDNARVMGGKRKHVDNSNDQVHIKVDDGDAKLELGDEVSQKKLREDGSQLINDKDSADAPFSENTKKIPSIPALSRDDDSKHRPMKENATSDIMSIVKGTNQRISKGLAGTKPSNKLTKNKENMAGLRMKKIMKRAPDQGESSLVVQNLREEIREAVRNKSSKNFGENLFDAKLLAAFRAAIAGPATEPVNKLLPIAVKAKKSMLQKGKIREHLTKKIFGTSNGRRKRAWDRDCEIEFWKYRCMRATKPEKIATLKSVLDLLRETSESPELREGPECQAKNPILSRLYLADTSVFPRKNDVKPLSALKTAANSEQSKQHNPSGRASNLSLDDSTIKATEINNVLSKARVCSSENKVCKKLVHGSVGDNSASGKVPLSRHSKGASISCSGGSKVDSKEFGVKSDSIKSDKRKWALEVLARKTAAAGKKTNESEQDNADLKGNYPLLAQLPADMRPVLAPSHHNKIPISVRQTQLYRLTEHFLRNTNLSVIRRTAVTELAVADAINIEKEVADRSNSKLVYLNLCSQELLHRSSNRKSNGVTDSIPPVSSADLTDRSEQNADDLSTDPAVEIALKNAGLLSDSPPSSPHEKREISNKEDDMSGPDNILELDSHPEMDIYGDFEYDLEDEDYIGASVAKVSNPQEEESKMKLIFSTMNLKNSDTALDWVDCERFANNEVPRDPSCSSNHNDAGNRDSAIDADFEELYGPDKEPLTKKFPDEESITLHGEGNTGTITEGNDCHKEQVSDHVVNASSEFGNENLAENVLVTAIAGSSSNISESSEDVRRKEERSDTAAEQSDSANHVSRKVEAYVKEHIRPLCKSGVITAEQYRWAAAKTTEKVMKYHSKAKSANFLIKEGEKVKKLAEQYVEAAQQNKKKIIPRNIHVLN